MSTLDDGGSVSGLVDVLRRLDALEAENRLLRSELAAVDGPREAPDPSIPPGSSPVPTPAVLSRRGLLAGAAGVAAAGAAAVVATAAPAAAANGGSVILGGSNSASAVTSLNSTSTLYGLLVTQGSGSGLPAGNAAIVGDSQAGAGVVGLSAGGAITAGVMGESTDGPGVTGTSTNWFGVGGTSTDGPGLGGYSTNSSGVYGLSDKGPGLASASNRSHLRFYPGQTGWPAPPMTTTLIQRYAGEILMDTNRDYWVCVADGVPGKWRKIAGPATAGSLHLLAVPVRVYDSRPGMAPTSVGPKSPMVAGTARMIDLTANSSTLPSLSAAAVVTVLVVDAASGNGNLTIWKAAAAQPSSNTLVWGGTSGRAAITAVTGLDGYGRCQAVASIGCDLVVDVVGYYL